MAKKREFYITRCSECGCVDGAIEKTAKYDATRDLQQWQEEDRHVSVYVQEKLGQFPDWCRCDLLNQEEEEEV